MIGMIVATDRNNLIGYDSTIPWRKPADLKRFKTLTSGGVVIMGRKTFESIGRCLPNRVNIVVTSKPIECDPAPAVHATVASALSFAREQGKPIWVIGGAQIYAATLDLVDFIDLTLVCERTPVEDASLAVYFPPIPRTFTLGTEATNSEDNSLIHRRYVRKNEGESQRAA